jgi:hypothetical protein
LGCSWAFSGTSTRFRVYIALPKDSEGKLFDGSEASYELKFNKEQLPPAKYFWSMTMYKLPQRWLVDNPIDRYSIGSTTEGIKYGEDGSLAIEIAAKSPGKDKESNWLPAPEGPFWLVMRTYGPGKSIVDSTYKAPPIAPTK